MTTMALSLLIRVRFSPESVSPSGLALSRVAARWILSLAFVMALIPFCDIRFCDWMVGEEHRVFGPARRPCRRLSSGVHGFFLSSSVSEKGFSALSSISSEVSKGCRIFMPLAAAFGASAANLSWRLALTSSSRGGPDELALIQCLPLGPGLPLVFILVVSIDLPLSDGPALLYGDALASRAEVTVGIGPNRKTSNALAHSNRSSRIYSGRSYRIWRYFCGNGYIMLMMAAPRRHAEHGA